MLESTPRFAWKGVTSIIIALTLFALLIRSVFAHTEVIGLVPNGDFEAGTTGWNLGTSIASISAERAISGKYALKISDFDTKSGSDVLMARLPIQKGAYVVRGKIFPVSGKGIGLYVRVFDQEGNLVGPNQDAAQVTLPSSSTGQWKPFDFAWVALDGAASVEFWIHSYNDAKVEAYIDDIAIAPSTVKPVAPPWQGTYKIKPSEKAKLTAADVVGPDGVVYPDWHYAGKPGGIPRVRTVTTIEAFGARANDNLDDSTALERAAEVIGQRGGGAIQLGAGTYVLDRPILITRDNVVIRGMGANQTKLIFRYNKRGESPTFFQPRPGQTIDANTWIEADADPNGLKALEIQVEGRTLVRKDQRLYANATYSVGAIGADALAKVANKEGRHQFRIIAEYADGRKLESTAIFATTSATPKVSPHIPRQVAAITFCGVSKPGNRVLLVRDGKRGETRLMLQSATGLRQGSRISLTAPATPRWNALVGNACKYGDYRRYEFLVTSVRGNEITLNQPLRLDYPTIDGSYIEQISPIRNCGVENLSLEQTHNLWTSGIFFSFAWECWAKGVTVKKAGRYPLYAMNAKWLEFRDVIADDCWIKGDGGTGYMGWDYGYDCLLDGVTTYKLRHSPLVQWSASGNVIRRGVMHDSDAQWHAGWTNENLFEQCVITSVQGNGGYGYGMYGTVPNDGNHGPEGPRNVVYNCDVSSPKSGVSMGGMNENWLFLHNRFIVGSGPGVYGQKASFDHIFQDNVFVLKDANHPAFSLSTPDCVGWELRGNTILGGNGQLSEGLAEPLVSANNKLLPPGEAPRPKPAVPSIFEWQRRKH